MSSWTAVSTRVPQGKWNKRHFEDIRARYLISSHTVIVTGFGKDLFLPKELSASRLSPKAPGEAQHPAAMAAGEAVQKNLLPDLLTLVL